jgi:hypothetical protein
MVVSQEDRWRQIEEFVARAEREGDDELVLVLREALTWHATHHMRQGGGSAHVGQCCWPMLADYLTHSDAWCMPHGIPFPSLSLLDSLPLS